MYRFVFWQGIMSIHQSALLRNLADFPKTEVILVVWDEIPTNRRKYGWHIPDFGKTKIVMKPPLQEQQELLSTNVSDTIHIFSGTRGHPKIWNALRFGHSTGITYCIQSESQKSIGVMGWLRLMRNRYDSRILRDKTKLVFGIGSLAMDWYKRCGYNPTKILPFGYFVETPPAQVPDIRKKPGKRPFKMIFVGRPLRPKGLDILLSSLKSLTSLDWHLHIIGDGDDGAEFKEFCRRFGFANRVCFNGVVKYEDVIRFLMKSDLLILPSRWDGWGAVINEALMCGTPAICSDRCGAADLIRMERGQIFKSESTTELRAILEAEISKGSKHPMRSASIREWSHCIEGESAARYFVDAIEASFGGGMFPTAPWLIS